MIIWTSIALQRLGLLLERKKSWCEHSMYFIFSYWFNTVVQNDQEEKKKRKNAKDNSNNVMFCFWFDF